ncbi:GNAT family N-acetyltransferase [Legionella jamestowniensis]|uniref:Putative Acyl-CoA N-acyltransferase n=1 Tax=Legionella jamestowniensis TaxID=455 RepID=A0A0W0UN59_9GAMM|nr:GNAT family N-acetyltransferase [Legionella jamestowniensis]KTD09307.1 putative Acyl-CoA N-acyltransferase [Legionella jamestowniensis]SFL87372.1 Acetyltransferase (GNAT) family protein [Legionella jamestowniensis DSM 19215]
MLLFSSALTKHKLTFTKLSDCMDYVPIAAKWAEDEWGYIRNKGIDYRAEVMRTLKDNVYIGTFAGQPVAMFALLDHSFNADLVKTTDNLTHARELMYVYVEKDCRGLGFGKQIIEKAKRLAAELGSDLILLDTLKPSLNGLYKKHGAEVVCEGQLFSHPTDVLRIVI